MTFEVDTRRACTVRVVDDITAPDATPGSVEVHAMGERVWGYGYRCPGCNARSYLAIDPEQPHPRWSVAAGDAAHPETVTLTPSIFHTAALGGCGWHGYLTRGVLTPC